MSRNGTVTTFSALAVIVLHHAVNVLRELCSLKFVRMSRVQTELAEPGQVATPVMAAPPAAAAQPELRRWPIYLSLSVAILVSLTMWAGIVWLVSLIV